VLWRVSQLLVLSLAILGLLQGPEAFAGAAKATKAQKSNRARSTQKRKQTRRPAARGQKHVSGKFWKSSKSLGLGERLKFSRVQKFAGKLPAVRKSVAKALASPKADQATARAAIIRLMDTGFLRVGSEQYAARNEKPSFGASSLRKEHVTVKGNRVTVKFIGKSGVKWKKSLTDPQLAAAIRQFKKLPGPRLFQVPTKSGKLVMVTEVQIRAELKSYGAKPKDFRTHHANRIFVEALSKQAKPKNDNEARSNVIKARNIAAKALNHLPETSQESYLHPKHVESYLATSGRSARGPPSR